MSAYKIKSNIYWVGAVDWKLRNFHGYSTQRGSSYNAYLIIDEKITLIDTAKSTLTDDLFSHISEIIDPKDIDYVVCNHVEMDHSGNIPRIMSIAENAQLFASPNGARGLKAHYGDDLEVNVVKTGDSLSLGKYTLNFVLTPMVHWPDNMVTYMPEEKILFSNDAFGQHIASSQRTDIEYPEDIIYEEAKKYYANIVLPYGAQVQKALQAVDGLDIEVIAPSHGIIWMKNINEIIEMYKKWSSNTTDKKAVIVYDTMWGSTEKMAYTILNSFIKKGYNVALRSLEASHISDVMTDIMEAEYICVGSPTLNNNILPTVASFIAYLKGLAPKNRKAIAFGSYGWGGQSVGIIEKELKECSMDVEHTFKQNYIPKNEDLVKITEALEEEF